MIMKSILSVTIILIFFGNGMCVGQRQQNMQLRNNNTIEYYTKPKHDHTLNVLLHIDYALTQNLSAQYGPKTRRKIKTLTKEIVKDLEKYFKIATFGQKLNVNLMDVKFLRKGLKFLKVSENGTEYLKSYCEWQSKKKKGSRFYSILMTGLDIYIKGINDRRSTGRGYLGGVCSIKKSCALLEWKAKNIGFVLAHEIAHSLGVQHDGRPHNRCRSTGYIMAAQFNSRRLPRTWSACSRRSLNVLLSSQRAWCLRPNKYLDHDDIKIRRTKN